MAKKSIKEMISNGGEDAQYRVAAKSICKLTRGSLVKVLEKANLSSDAAKQAELFLDSELGLAAIGFLSGLALNYAPHISENEKVQRISEEFTTESIATVGNVFIENIVGEIMPILSSTLESLPQPKPQARIAEVTSISDVKQSKEEKQSSSVAKKPSNRVK